MALVDVPTKRQNGRLPGLIRISKGGVFTFSLHVLKELGLTKCTYAKFQYDKDNHDGAIILSNNSSAGEHERKIKKTNNLIYLHGQNVLEEAGVEIGTPFYIKFTVKNGKILFNYKERSKAREGLTTVAKKGSKK